MFKNETKNSIMAFAVVAMFVISAFAVVLTPLNADENDGQTYTINMKVGDAFTYTPDANLGGSGEGAVGTTTYKWAKTSGTDLITGATKFTPASGVNGTTFEFTPAAAGNMTVTLTATWTGPSGSNITQTATQILIFNVVDKIVFSGSKVSPSDTASASSATASVTLTAGFASAQNYSFSVTGGETGHVATFDSPTITTGSGITATGNGTASMSVTIPAGIAAGTYEVAMPATFTIPSSEGSATGATQTKTLTFTITVAAGLAISTNGPFYTVIGDSNYDDLSFTVTQTDGVTISTIDYAIDATAESNWATTDDGITYVESGTWSGDGTVTGTYTLPTDSTYNNSKLSAQSATVNFSVTVTANSNASDAPSVSTLKNFVLNVYKDLKFTTVPIMDGNAVKVFNSSVDGRDVLLTTSVEGVNKITYVWGDGTYSVKENENGKASYFSADHRYTNAGTYFIQITAENDFGEKTVITPYTTGSAVFTVDDEPKVLKMTSIKATENEDSTLLTAVMQISEGATPAYKWTYSIDGEDAVEVTAAGTPAWITALDGQKLTFNNAHDDIAGKTVKFTCTASVLFEGNEKEDTVSASYTFNSPAADSYFWIVFLVIAVVLFGLAYFGVFDAYLPGFFGYIPAVIFVILTIAFFVYGDFNGIIDAINGKK